MSSEEQYVLTPQSCAQVALHMYQEYQKAMQPPLFRVLSFEEWLTKIIESDE